MENHIYLDNAATTRLAPDVLDAMLPYLREDFGNAATLYSLGQAAGRAVETAREQVASLLHAASAEEVVFTSSSTEANNWVLKSISHHSGKKHLVSCAIEHHSVLDPLEYLQKHAGMEVTLLPVDAQGRVNPADLEAALRDDTALVSIMHANNEIGTLEPIRELAALAHARGALFHTDICQTAGKISVDLQALEVDFASLSAHKFHGPKGVGALYIRKGVRLEPLLHGGGQEKHRRAGTTNVAGCVGLGAAAERAHAMLAQEVPRQEALVERLWQGLQERIPVIRRNGDPEVRIPGLLSICAEGVEGESILLRMDMAGIQVSSGSACTTGSLDPSHVLLAIGLPAEIAHGSVRMSMSDETTSEDVDVVLEKMPPIIETLRAMSPTWKG